MKYYKFALYKAYFDKGYGVSSYIKYLLAFVSLATLDVKLILILAGIYGVCCFVLGYYWYKWRIADAEAEVANQFNPFCNEVRQKLDVKAAGAVLITT